MRNFKVFLWSAGLMAATTIGAGLFALPYIFREAGWLLGLSYLILLTVLLVFAHHLYWRVLEKVKEKNRLLGLAATHLGKAASLWAFFIIVGGLILTLLIYLILSAQFLTLIFPGSGTVGIIIFWLVSSFPIFVELRRLISLELWGGIIMTSIILFIFFTSPSGETVIIPAFNLHNFFLPFGVVIFSLAGWTAVEPILDYQKKMGVRLPGTLAWGTLAVTLLYLMFVFGILTSVPEITPDTLSGLTGWPTEKVMLLGWLGLFALWTSYIPIGLEIKNSLERDVGWPRLWSVAFVVFVPPLLFFLGLQNFLKVLSLAGGVFLSLQYLLIVRVSKRVITFRPWEKFLSTAVVALFVLAAVYEAYTFVIQ